MKRQRAKQRPLYRYDVYRGRRRGQARLIGAAGCAVFGLLLVLIRSLGIRFSGFLLLGLAALLVLSWLLDRLAAGNHRWRLIHRGFYGCLTVGLAALLGLEVFIINRGRSDMTPLPADAVIVLGAGVNGTEPSLSLRTRLDKAVDYLERWPDIPAVLTGGTGLWRGDQRGGVHVRLPHGAWRGAGAADSGGSGRQHGGELRLLQAPAV